MFRFTAKPRITVLVLPGIGDIHWVLCKLNGMRAFPEQEVVMSVWEFDGRPRSMDFVKKIPFVTPGRYYMNKSTAILRTGHFSSIYRTGLNDVITDWLHFDYVIGFNGSLVNGKYLERDILPDVPTDWNYPITSSLLEQVFVTKLRQKGVKKHILFYASDHGMFFDWIKYVSVERLRKFIVQLTAAFPDHTLVLTGSSCDLPFLSQLNTDRTLNLAGETSIDELFGLIRSASCFVGWPGGNTIISQHLNTPTLMVWSKDRFPNMAFRTNWVDPSKIGRVYRTAEVTAFDEPRMVADVAELIKHGCR